MDETDWGTYLWPETFGGAQAALKCMEDRSISVTRECLAGGRWDEPAYGGCALLALTVNNNKNMHLPNYFPPNYYCC